MIELLVQFIIDLRRLEHYEQLMQIEESRESLVHLIWKTVSYNMLLGTEVLARANWQQHSLLVTWLLGGKSTHSCCTRGHFWFLFALLSETVTLMSVSVSTLADIADGSPSQCPCFTTVCW